MKTKIKETVELRLSKLCERLNRYANRLCRWQKILVLLLFVGMGSAFFIHRMIRSPGKKGMEWSEISVPRLPTDSVKVNK
ncbi:hypothetical protein [uncultured Pedobacter sp.]|uniref:hypothetical protein n=1 Tax=uncultured Pedobacter sp. TaxID=246139 RepID=UPI00260E7449|nr:hypothetical protein [uncultured Pedobacter sp.]